MTAEQIAQIIDAINTGAWSVVGSIWALIFAVTWKG